MATPSKELLTLQDIERKIRNIRVETVEFRKRVRELKNRMARNNSWMSQIALDEEKDDLQATARFLLEELKKVEDALDKKHNRAFKDFEKYILLRAQLKKRCDIAVEILRLINQDMPPDEMESKLARTYGGAYKWKAQMGDHIMREIFQYFHDPNNIDVKTKLQETLSKVKIEIDPEPVEGEEASRKVQNLQQLEVRIEQLKEELTLIPAYAVEECRLYNSINEGLNKLTSANP